MWLKENWFKITLSLLILFGILIFSNYLQEKNKISTLSAYAECRGKLAELDGKVPDILKLSNACEDIVKKGK